MHISHCSIKRKNKCKMDRIISNFAESQVLLYVTGRYDTHCISHQSLDSQEAPNHRSLQSEMQDMQQVGSACCLQLTFSFC